MNPSCTWLDKRTYRWAVTVQFDFLIRTDEEINSPTQILLLGEWEGEKESRTEEEKGSSLEKKWHTDRGKIRMKDKQRIRQKERGNRERQLSGWGPVSWVWLRLSQATAEPSRSLSPSAQWNVSPTPMQRTDQIEHGFFSWMVMIRQQELRQSGGRHGTEKLSLWIRRQAGDIWVGNLNKKVSKLFQHVMRASFSHSCCSGQGRLVMPEKRVHAQQLFLRKIKV